MSVKATPEQGKIYENRVCNKGLKFTIYKQLLKLENRKRPDWKLCKGFMRHFSNYYITVEDKSTIRYHFTSIRMATIREIKKKTTKKQGFTRMWRIWNPLHCWWGAAAVVMTELTCTPAISILGTLTQEFKASNWTDVHTHVHSTIVENSQNL